MIRLGRSDPRIKGRTELERFDTEYFESPSDAFNLSKKLDIPIYNNFTSTAH